MRSFTEIHTDIQAATAKNDVEALTRLANEMDGINTPLADAIRSKARGLVCRQLGDLAEAVNQYRRAFDAFEGEGHQFGMALTLDDIGVVYLALGETSAALVSFNRALEIFQELDDFLGIGDTYGDLGKLYMHAASYPEALEYYNRALEAYERLDDPRHSSWMLANIGALYAEINEYQKGLEFLERSLIVASELGDRDREARSIGNMGMVYHAMGEYSRAVESCRRSLSIFREIGHEPSVQMHLIMLCTALTGAQLAEEARLTLTELEAMEAPSPIIQVYRDSCAADLATLEGDLDSARALYLKALELSQHIGLRSSELDLHKRLRDLAQKRTDFDGYIHHNTEFQRINEDILGKGAVQRIALAEAEKQMRSERQERERERAVLYSTLPRHIAERAVRGETIEDHFENAAVLFADIIGFTTHSSTMPPSETIKLLEEIFSRFDVICEQHDVVKVKTIGDSYVCFAYAQSHASARNDQPSFDARIAERLARVALAMQQSEFFWPSNDAREAIQFRIGVHSGPLSAGVIGTQRLQYDIWGDTVNVASRMESTGEPGKIHVSERFASFLVPHFVRNDNSILEDIGERNVIPSATRNEEPGTWHLAPRGEIEIKGKGPMLTYWLESA